MFIPRKVSRPNDVTRRLAATRPEFVQESVILQEDVKGKAKTIDTSCAASEELAALVHLALSRHSIWVNPELISSDDGYVPLFRLICESDGFTDMETAPSEADVVRAVQKHLSSSLEARILVSSPQKSVWHSPGSRSDVTGGYEIRRKDWRSLRSVTVPLRKSDWDAKTVYLEKLPTRIRSVATVYRFVLSLLNSRKSCPFDVVQDVKLVPPSHAEAEFKRAFKGFAFVTFSTKELAKQLVDDWPWLAADRPMHLLDGTPTSATPEVTDAHKYGMRVITKARWEELRDEYLAYRMQLLNVIHEEGRKSGTKVQQKPAIAEPGPPPSEPRIFSNYTHQQDYPRGCLTLARNVHTETNKTTLRKLFSSAVGARQDVLDYVDFNKGVDSCFLRIRSPGEASALVEHFRTHPLAQSNGLDGDGITPSGSMKPIIVELVEGKKEELYWEKVPEKSRRQAVQNILQLSGGGVPVETRFPSTKRRRKE